jgi:hypothetical protein
MGTNYYRIPTVDEMEERKARLARRVTELEMTPSNIEHNFNTIPTDSPWEHNNPWNEFVEDTNIHLGKRSSGWKFCWNFHKDQYYHDLKTLYEFVLSGRVVNEYGEELDSSEFMEMALEWGQPDGLIGDKEYFDKTEHHRWMSNPEAYYDRVVDGLRVSSSTEFS